MRGGTGPGGSGETGPREGVRGTRSPAGRPAAVGPASGLVRAPGPGPVPGPPGAPAANHRLVGGRGAALGGVPGPRQAEGRGGQKCDRLHGEDQVAASLTVGDGELAAPGGQPE